MNRTLIIEQRNKILKNKQDIFTIIYQSTFHNYGCIEVDIHISELTKPKLMREAKRFHCSSIKQNAAIRDNLFDFIELLQK